MSDNKDFSAYDDLIADVLREAGVEDEPAEPDVPETVEEAINQEVDDFVNSVVEEAELPEPAEKKEEEPAEEEKPEHVKRTLADFPDAKYKVITYNDKSDQKAFYLYSILGRYPAFPIILFLVVCGLSVWFAFNGHRGELLRYALLYLSAFILAAVGFFSLRIYSIVKKIGQKDEHALDTVRVEVAFFEEYLVLIKYGFDIRMDYSQLEHYGRMGDRIYLYFDNRKALLIHADDFSKETYAAVDAMLKQVVRTNKGKGAAKSADASK